MMFNNSSTSDACHGGAAYMKPVRVGCCLFVAVMRQMGTRIAICGLELDWFDVHCTSASSLGLSRLFLSQFMQLALWLFGRI
jgi:hypothetical protein